MKKKLCVIGSGRWGINHIRTLYELNALGGVIDKNRNNFDFIADNYPLCRLFNTLEDDIIKEFDGFIIATDPSSHFELASKVILGKKPVLVEKPLTLDYTSSKALCDMAKETGVNLMVGHVLLFHPAFRKMKNLIVNGKVGEIQYIYSNRLNMGSFRTNENVFWSFAPHDVALLNYFMDEKPTGINSKGIDIIQNGIHDTSITTFDYHGKKMAHIFVSWLHPFKEHRFVIIGSKGMLHFEDSANSGVILFYDNKANFDGPFPTPSLGSVNEIKYEPEQPLKNELKYFISNLDSRKIKISSGEDGIDVIRILEEASREFIS